MKGKIRPENHLERQSVFPPRRDYSSLSMKDLLDARDAYHVYLSSLDNVVATAIGRYMIKEKDWYATHPPGESRPEDFPIVTEPRTMQNSVIKPWSWPAVLVFVRDWKDPKKLGGESVPRSLFLPDGRVIPTCVVLATPDESLPPAPVGPFHVSGLLGSGYSCIREHQGEQSLGTFSCLVQRGGTYYALTNRHVAGGEGEEVRAYVHGKYHRIGKTSSLAVDRLAMSNVFPLWSGPRVLLTLDAGLIQIDDIGDWTSQAFGIGEIGQIFDATEQSITLDLIGCPVRAFGGVSGLSEGEIRALFFRYESMGGFEYTTDVLIGSKKESADTDHPLTRPGDSGTLWFYDPSVRESEKKTEEGFENSAIHLQYGARARRLRPIAMQWGGQRVALPGGARSSFALGSFLSTVCRALDVEIIRSWSTGHDEYWGKLGHFAIGWKACEQLSGTLDVLMRNNQKRIGFGDDKLGKGSEFRMGRNDFVPLADVPDYVWIKSRPQEPVQHFADVDIHDIDGGPSMLEQCMQDPAKVSATVWKAYFDGFANAGVGPDEGCLPFRVWQLWEAMVNYVLQGDLLHYVAAAGVLAHYIGDASQPLHCSYKHHGKPPMKKVGHKYYPVPKDSDEFKAFKKTKAAKVHAIYEEGMLEVDTGKALEAINDAIAVTPKPQIQVASGHDAAVATVHLMNDSQDRLSPSKIISIDDPAATVKERSALLWSHPTVRNATVASIVDSVNLLALLWTSAWEKGGGNNLSPGLLVELEEPAVANVCRHEPDFVPSLSLKAYAESGKYEP